MLKSRVCTLSLLLLWIVCVVQVDSNVELWRCGKSFLDLPTIYTKDQHYADVCIPLSDDVMSLDDAKCGSDVAHACVAVRYLKDFNIPLYAGVHFQNSPDVVLGLSRTNNYPKGRPIGMKIPQDDGVAEASDESAEKVVRRKELPVTVKDNKVPEEGSAVWSEVVWTDGMSFCFHFT